jgi:KDO2-lipid IV(A) lauroyltransferase
MNKAVALAEYAAIRAAVEGLSFLPRPAALRLGRALGEAVWLAGARRGVVDENLGTAFPGRDATWRRHVGRATYRHYGAVLVEMARWIRRPLAEAGDLVRVTGLARLEAALARGRGVVVMTAHLGNWEVGPTVARLHGLAFTSVYQRVRNPYLDAAVRRIRTLHGQRLVDRGMGLRGAIEALRRNELVAFLPDQDAGPRGVFAPFFGRPASTMRGPAEVALRTGAAVLPIFVLRRPGDSYEVLIEEEIPSDAAAPRDAEVARITAAYAWALEARIREAPEQYFWLHRRWKSQPAGASSAAASAASASAMKR